MIRNVRGLATGIVIYIVTPLVSMAAQSVPTSLTPQHLVGRPLRSLTDTMDIVLVRDGARRSGGQFIVTLTTATVEGRSAYLVIAHDRSPTGANTFDTAAVDAATLAPLWHRSHAPTDSAAVVYRDRVASGYADHDKQARSAVDFRLSAAAFEGGLVSWILPALPLRVGYAVTITSFSLWDNREDTTTYRVTGSERVEMRTGAVDTWVIREDHGPNDRAIRQQWIDKTTGRTIRTYDAPRPVAPGDGYWKISTLVKPTSGG